MPNGQKYEDWLKDRENHGGMNSAPGRSAGAGHSHCHTPIA
jgi:hypothetical protein